LDILAIEHRKDIYREAAPLKTDAASDPRFPMAVKLLAREHILERSGLLRPTNSARKPKKSAD